LHHRGGWSARFTQEEINGWLATDLPAKFSTALPAGFSRPRVAIGPHEAQFAASYQQRGWETVFSLAGDVHLTTEPNEIAIRIKRVRAGALPMPLSKLLEDLSGLAARAEIPLRWTEVEGDPVALLRMPLEVNERQLSIDAVELTDGAFVIAGRIEAPLR